MSIGLYITILAGGMGKRMNNDKPKVLLDVKGKPMIIRTIQTALELAPEKIIIVVGKFYDLIKNVIDTHFPHNNFTYAHQSEPLGTGDAIKATLELLPSHSTHNIILNSDVPSLKSSTVGKIYEKYLTHQYKLLITAIELSEPAGNGRIIASNNTLEAIVEEKDCDDEQKEIKIVNCGIYICDTQILQKYIPMITNNNAQHEYYLTDIVHLFKQHETIPIGLHILDPSQSIEIYNVNTASQLQYINQMHI